MRSSTEQTAGRMNLLLSINTNQIFTCSNRAGSVIFFPEADFKQQVQNSCLMWCDCVLERFKLKNLFTKKSISYEKLANARYVLEIQPTGTMVVDS